MVLCLLPALGTTALAASGSGTEGDPYVVTDYDELRELLRSKTESDPTCYIKLGGDITDSSSRNNHKLSIHDGADIVLDLAGHSLTRSGSTTDYCLFAVCGASLTVNDSVGGGGITARTVAGGPYLTGAAIWVQNWSKSRLTVNGGTLTVNASGDGLDSNGALTINGGTVYVSGPTGDGNGTFDCDGVFTINGGVVLGTGSSGMLKTPTTDSKQNTISVSCTGSAGDTVEVKGADGNTLVSAVAPKSFTNVTFSTPDITEGETYTVYVNGTEAASETCSGVVRGATGMGSFGGGPGNCVKI